MVTILLASGLLALIFGIIILIWPKALNLGVAIYLIITGILQLISEYAPQFSPY
ncbi:MAG TPA: DUF3096 domain-containing protein [Candidatus Nanoarchaeia archaeon]|nr:DUF3096 domain-containing protein [Candidatus Nanoarchaeia archaeon]